VTLGVRWTKHAADRIIESAQYLEGARSGTGPAFIDAVEDALRHAANSPYSNPFDARKAPREMGALLGIATREKSKGPMKLHERARVAKARGVEDDSRGRSPGRSIVVLTREGWEEASRDLWQSPDWTTRRANFFVEGVNFTGQTGRRLRVGR
jgi:hypothetical protein